MHHWESHGSDSRQRCIVVSVSESRLIGLSVQIITDGHRRQPAGCLTNATGNSASTDLLPGFSFFLEAEFFPQQEIELPLCTVAALRCLGWFRSCRLFGLGLCVGRAARFLALYIRFGEVAYHHSTTSTHKHQLYQFLLLSTASPPSLTTASCSVPPETGN